MVLWSRSIHASTIAHTAIEAAVTTMTAAAAATKLRVEKRGTYAARVRSTTAVGFQKKAITVAAASRWRRRSKQLALRQNTTTIDASGSGCVV